MYIDAVNDPIWAGGILNGCTLRCILFGSDHSMPVLSVTSTVCHSTVCGGAGLNCQVMH